MDSHNEQLFADVPAVVVSHSTATDDLERQMASVRGSHDRFRFLDSTNNQPHDIQEALTSVLGIRAPGGPSRWPAGVPGGGWNPIVVQVFAAAEVGGTVLAIEETARTVRHEFDRSFLSGTSILIAYLGPIDGTLPRPQFLKGLKSIDRFFDLVVLISDSDVWGRRYIWPDIEAVISRFIHLSLRSVSLRQFMFDVAAGLDPKNCFVTFGLGRVDVSEESVRSLVYSHLSRALFETLFSCDEKGESPAALAEDSAYLSSRHRATGSLGSVVSALDPAERQLACKWREARARELAERTKITLSARRDDCVEKPRSRLPRVLGAVRKYFFREPPRKHLTPTPKAEKITNRKAKLLGQLIRLKQIELEFQPAMGAPHHGSLFPLDISLTDLPSGEHDALADLVNAKNIVWTLSQETSLDDLLSGRVAAKQLAGGIDVLWKEHLVPEKIADFLGSNEFGDVLDVLAGNVSPLLPSVGSDGRKLILSPPGVANTTQVEGFETAVGFPGEYVLVAANECSDLCVLDSQGAPSDG